MDAKADGPVPFWQGCTRPQLRAQKLITVTSLAMMSSWVKVPPSRVPAVKEARGPRPASLSEKVHQILREELGFDGVIMTDDLIMQAIIDYTESKFPLLSVQKNEHTCNLTILLQYHRQVLN